MKSRRPNTRIATRPPSRRKSVRVYRADGTGESQDETFVKVLTEKGKRNNRTISLAFMLPYSTVEVVKVEVLKPDGAVVAVDVAANSKEQIDDSQMSENISDPNSRVLRVSIPKVEIGDVVHSITRETIERSIIPGEFAEESVFEGEGFLRHLVLRGPRAQGPAFAADCVAGRNSRHRATFHPAGRRRLGDPPLGGQQCPAHVPGAGHAAGGNGVAAPAGQHHARLAVRSPSGIGT